MAHSYNGSATGITESTTVTITEPDDFDPLTVASVEPTALEKLTNFVEYLRANTAKKGTDSSLPNGQTGTMRFNVANNGGPVLVAKTGDLGSTTKRSMIVELDGSATGQFAALYHTGQVVDLTEMQGDVELARNCKYRPGTDDWACVDTTLPATKVVLSVNGLLVYTKSATASAWGDSFWDKAVKLPIGSWTQGDVLGVTTANLLTTGRPREADSGSSVTDGSGFTGSQKQLFKDASNVVHFHGRFAGTLSGTAFQTIATLPAGFRPAQQQVFVVTASYGVTSYLGEVDVNTDGTVNFQFRDNPGSPSTASGTVFISGLTWPV